MAQKLTLGEQTGKQEGSRTQIGMTFGEGLLTPQMGASYQTYRDMRKDPTIALAMALGIAPIVAAEWSLEERDDAPKGAKDLIEECFIPVREPFIETCLIGGTVYGWQPWEKVFEERDGLVVLRKLKPLLQEITKILVDKETGQFTGFKQKTDPLPLANSLLINFRVEGTQWHGQSLLENARKTWNEWREANAGAARYDRRVAGAHFLVYYPVGQSLDATGRMRQNSEIGKTILNALESSGSVLIPTQVEAYIDDLNKNREELLGWKITILEDKSARQPTFIDRLSYLDKLKVRALILPERAIMEGRYGTKAEAGEHIDLALTHAELTHRHVTRLMNWHAVDQLLALNYGEKARGAVKLVATPIVDAKLQMFSELYKAMLANPAGFMEEYSLLDTAAIKDALGIPQSPEQENGKEPPLKGMDTNSPMAATVRELYGRIQAKE